MFIIYPWSILFLLSSFTFSLENGSISGRDQSREISRLCPSYPYYAKKKISFLALSRRPIYRTSPEFAMAVFDPKVLIYSKQR